MVGAIQQQVVARHQLQLGLAAQAAEAIGQQGPAGAPLPAAQGLHLALPVLGEAAPGARHHQAGAIEVGQRPRAGRSWSWSCEGSRHGSWRGRRCVRKGGPGLQQGRAVGVERLGKGKVEMHRPRGLAGAPGGQQGGVGQLGDGPIGHGGQASAIALAQPAHTRRQETLLVDTLVGATALELVGPIRRDQQQGDGAVIGLHRCRQQVGDGGSGGGDHRCRLARGPAQPQGKKGGGALIHAGVETEPLGLQQAGRLGQGCGAAARAEHHLGQAMAHQRRQEHQRRLQVAGGQRHAGAIQDGRPILACALGYPP